MYLLYWNASSELQSDVNITFAYTSLYIKACVIYLRSIVMWDVMNTKWCLSKYNGRTIEQLRRKKTLSHWLLTKQAIHKCIGLIVIHNKGFKLHDSYFMN